MKGKHFRLILKDFVGFEVDSLPEERPLNSNYNTSPASENYWSINSVARYFRQV